jgi:hypothetical protein
MDQIPDKRRFFPHTSKALADMMIGAVASVFLAATTERTIAGIARRVSSTGAIAHATAKPDMLCGSQWKPIPILLSRASKKCPAWNLVAGGDVSTPAFSGCTFDLAQLGAIGREAAFKDQIQH